MRVAKLSVHVASLAIGLCIASLASAQIRSISDPSAFHPYSSRAKQTATVQPQLAEKQLVPQKTSASSDNQEQKFGGFSLRTIIDPMSDASRGILVSPEGDVRMVIKCDGNGPGSLYISLISAHYLGALEYHNRDVKYRIDGQPPETVNAYYDDRTANILDLKPSSAGGRFLTRLIGASKFTVQVDDFEGEAYTSVMDMDGFRAGLIQAASICKDSNWYSIAQ